MTRDGWTESRYYEICQHELSKNGVTIATVSRVSWKTFGPWSVRCVLDGWLGKIGSASTVSEGKAMAEAWIARQSK